MDELIPITDETLEKARQDSNFRQKMVSEYLERLMTAMNRVKANRQKRGKSAPSVLSVELRERTPKPELRRRKSRNQMFVGLRPLLPKVTLRSSSRAL